MSENVVAHVGDRYVVVEVSREDRSRVARTLLGVVGSAKGHLRTVTNVRHGLGFRLPVKYADTVHDSLFGPFIDDSHEVVDDGGIEEVEEVEVPNRSGRRDAWAEFLDYHDIAYPEDAKRAELIELWDNKDK